MQYYIAINRKPEGPFDHHELLSHGLTATSLVWTEGMTDWAEAQSIPELAELLFGPCQPDNVDDIDNVRPPKPPCPPQPEPEPQAPPQQAPYGQDAYGQGPYASQGQPRYAPGQQYGPAQPQFGPNGLPTVPCPKTWLAQSILATILCCLPFGIVGIVKAAQVESLWRQGRLVEAQAASASAGMWTKVSFFVGLAGYLTYPIVLCLGFLAGI